jgi:sarcosine oxidase, subunit alpha
MSGYRLPSGGKIDRAVSVNFRFDGVDLEGFAGDTLASALLAAGTVTVGQSRLGRPRGISTAGREEPNALVRVAGVDGPFLTPATEVELEPGLVATSADRAVAGRNRQRPSEHLYTCVDVLVIGAGPSGIAAAVASSRYDRHVLLLDERSELGGSLHGSSRTINGRPGTEWADRARDALLAEGRTKILLRSLALGLFDANLVLVREARPTRHLHPASERLWHVRARQVIIATGATERPLLFPGNDRPGIVLASAARAYRHRFGIAVGRRVAVFTSNDSGYDVIRDLREAGVAIVAVVDTRLLPSPISDEVRAAGIDRYLGHGVVATNGSPALASIDIEPIDIVGSALVRRGGPRRRIECDALLVAGGWDPALELYRHAGGQLRWDGRTRAYVPDGQLNGVLVAGAAAGAFTLGAALATGQRVGASGATGSRVRSDERFEVDSQESGSDTHGPGWLLSEGVSAHVSTQGGPSFVDLQRNVTARHIADAVRVGMRHPEHIKRYTTLGTGSDQGRTATVNAVGVIAALTGQPIDSLSPTSVRPPTFPVSFSLLAGPYRGELFDPVRHTPIHSVHAASGAVFEDAGQWKRPTVYLRSGEAPPDAVSRECLLVRNHVGLVDVSTLGKIEVEGPDAALFLDRVYTGNVSSIPVGSCRYGIMCRADGTVFDDGTITRIAQSHYIVTTTTGEASHVSEWLEEWLQTEWPELRVYCTNVSEQWATLGVAGPRSRDVLRRMSADIDFGQRAFPFMSFREVSLFGIPARIARISFSGELAYEISVPAWWGSTMWEATLAAGREFGIAPYGLEAVRVLRAEKGYIIVGQDTDATVTPLDLGLGRLISGRKSFIGLRSLSRPAMRSPDRRQLVGLIALRADAPLEEGSAIVVAADVGASRRTSGHVSSSYYSPTLGHSIALGLVAAGRDRIGSVVQAHSPSGDVSDVRVTAPVFYDPINERRDGLADSAASPVDSGVYRRSGGGSLRSARRSPLGKASPAPVVRDEFLRLAEQPFHSQTNLRIQIDRHARTELLRHAGIRLSVLPNRVTPCASGRALWLGPNEWLLVDHEPGTHHDQRSFQGTVEKLGGVAVDVSSARTVIAVHGRRSRELLARGCSLDLATTTFRPGMCAQTLLARTDVILECLGADKFWIFIPTSYARYVAQWLALSVPLMKGGPSMG